MRRILSLGLCSFLLLSNLNCSVNILKTFADTQTNESLYVDAKILVNNADYDGALAKIALMTDEYPTLAKVLELKASAYGGKCGLNFLNFVNSLAQIGTTRLLVFLLQAFKVGNGADIASCINAATAIDAIGTTANRTVDENFFMVVLQFAKIGNILSFYDDPTKTGNVNTGFDACSSGGAGNMTDAHVAQLGTGLTIAMANLQAVAGSVSLGGTQLTDLSNLCTQLAGIAGGAYNFCGITNPASFTATELKGIRSLVTENSAFGLGLTTGTGTCPGDITQCNCP